MREISLKGEFNGKGDTTRVYHAEFSQYSDDWHARCPANPVRRA
jgi:hypothetical protein